MSREAEERSCPLSRPRRRAASCAASALPGRLRSRGRRQSAQTLKVMRSENSRAILDLSRNIRKAMRHSGTGIERRRKARPRPSEHPVRFGFHCRWQVSWLAGLRVCAPSRLSPVAFCACAVRLQLRGQPRFWPLMGNPHRVPFSAASRSPRTPHHRLPSCHNGDLPTMPISRDTSLCNNIT